MVVLPPQLENKYVQRIHSSTCADGVTKGSKVLIVRSVGNAEEFLRLSQRELHSALNDLKLEYITNIRTLAEKAKERRFNTLPDAIRHLDSRLLPETQEEPPGNPKRVLSIPSDDIEPQSISSRKVAFQPTRGMIKTTGTRHTVQTAFRAIDKRLARPWFGSAPPATKGGKSEAVDVEEGVQREVPRWPWTVHYRAYNLEMDIIYNRYKNEIINPWMRSLKEEGEKSLIGTIELSSQVAKDLVKFALTREEKRYNRELDGKGKPMDQGAVQHLITGYGNLVASEAALMALVVHIRDKVRSGK